MGLPTQPSGQRGRRRGRGGRVTAFPPFLCHPLPGPSASLLRSHSSFVNAISSLCPQTTCDFHPGFLLLRLSARSVPIGEAGESHLPVCLPLPHCHPSVSRHAHTDDQQTLPAHSGPPTANFPPSRDNLPSVICSLTTLNFTSSYPGASIFLPSLVHPFIFFIGTLHKTHYHAFPAVRNMQDDHILYLAYALVMKWKANYEQFFPRTTRQQQQTIKTVNLFIMSASGAHRKNGTPHFPTVGFTKRRAEFGIGSLQSFDGSFPLLDFIVGWENVATTFTSVTGSNQFVYMFFRVWYWSEKLHN